jgi:quercetin dioxygenase-like cupin family protein
MTSRTLSAVLVAMLAGGIATADKAKKQGTLEASVTHPVAIDADDLTWVDAPPALPPGAKMAILDGSPMVANRVFAIRLKMPANYRIMPHWHPADEHVTVISGEVQIGHGDTFNAASMQRLGAGDYFVMPAKHHHFAMARRESVIQLHGVGPWGINYLNPADDPRKRKEPARPQTTRR